MKRMLRSCLALILVMSMILSMSGMVFAAGIQEEGTINYVSLGDSMTNGYGLTDYNNNGYDTYGVKAYPNQFAEWLVKNGYAAEVNHSKLAMSAMRVEDLHFILEFPVDDNGALAAANAKKFDETAWNAAFSVGDHYTWDEFTTWTGSEEDPNHGGRFWQNCGGTNAAAEAYQNAVKNADIISIGTGNANFGVFLLGRLMNAIGFDGDASEDAWINIDRALAECDPEVKAQVLELKATLDEQLAAKLAELDDAETAAMAEAMANAISYTVVSYVLNYAGVLERIMELNPDVEVMLVGIMNTMSGMDMTISVDGAEHTIPMNEVLSVIVEPVNAYIAALPAVMQAAGNGMYDEATFYYAEAPEVQCMVETYADALKNKDSVVRARFVEEIVGDEGEGLIWSMIKPMFNQMFEASEISLASVTLADVENYEASEQANSEKAFSCAVYVAFENAIVEASKDSVIPVESFAVLAGDLNGVFNGVAAALANAEITTPQKLTDALTNALIEDETLMGLLHLFGRMLIGNGLGAHPSVYGHNDLAAAVEEAYKTKHTAADAVVDKVTAAAEAVAGLVAEYYDEAYAYAYAEAKNAGYIDTAAAAIDGVIADLKAIDLSGSEMTDAFKAEVAGEIEEIIETLAASKALLLEADVLDDAALDALVAMLDEAGEAIENLLNVLEQAGVDVNDLVVVPALEKALDKLENEIIPEVIANLEAAIEEGTQWLLEKAGEAYDALVDAAVEATVTYGPKVADWVYDYLYNHPTEVIAFINEYGDDALEFLAQYQEEIFAVLGFLAETFGDDIAEYVLENYEDILAVMCQWLDKNGENAWDLIMVYVEELGLLDGIPNAEEIQAALEKVYELLDTYGDQILAEAETLVKALESALEALKDAIAENADSIEAAVLAKLENLVAEIENLIEELEQAITGEIESTVEQIQQKLEKLKNAVEELVETAAGVVNGKIQDAIAAFEAAYKDATSDDYTVTKDSYYVAIGDSSAVSQSYVYKLAAELGIDYNNLAQKGLLVEDAYAVLQNNVGEIAKADLITVGFSNNAFVEEALKRVMSTAQVDLDWSLYVGEEGTVYVDQALEDLKANFVESMDESTAGILTAAVESYAYNCVSYATNLPELVNAIRAINPDAVVIIVGMYNALDGVSINLNGTIIELGEYVDYLVEAAGLHATAYAMLTSNAIYVDAPDVETKNTATELNIMQLFGVFSQGMMDPSDAGHEYIKDQILNALNITVEETGLLGDADSNGVVDNFDAMLVLQYSVSLKTADDLNLSVCDVDGNGVVDNFDAMLILQYSVSLINKFPAEKQIKYKER